MHRDSRGCFQPPLDVYAEIALNAAREAGATLLEHYVGTGVRAVRLKDDSSPLTEADLASHRVLVRVLKQAAPDPPMLSEEARRIPYAERAAWSRYWLIDPLDGTKGFLKRTDEFTVNIALVEQGIPLVGVVHAPALRQTFVAVKGGGAYRLGDNGQWVRLATVRANPKRIRILASRHHAGPVVQRLLERVAGAETVSMDGALKFCLIAEGRADLYYRDRPTMEWDTAAGQCILEEAGGVVRTADGDTLTYNKVELVNPPFVAAGDPSIDWTGRIQRILEGRDWMDA